MADDLESFLAAIQRRGSLTPEDIATFGKIAEAGYGVPEETPEKVFLIQVENDPANISILQELCISSYAKLRVYASYALSKIVNACSSKWSEEEVSGIIQWTFQAITSRNDFQGAVLAALTGLIRIILTGPWISNREQIGNTFAEIYRLFEATPNEWLLGFQIIIEVTKGFTDTDSKTAREYFGTNILPNCFTCAYDYLVRIVSEQISEPHELLETAVSACEMCLQYSIVKEDNQELKVSLPMATASNNAEHVDFFLSLLFSNQSPNINVKVINCIIYMNSVNKKAIRGNIITEVVDHTLSGMIEFVNHYSEIDPIVKDRFFDLIFTVGLRIDSCVSPEFLDSISNLMSFTQIFVDNIETILEGVDSHAERCKGIDFFGKITSSIVKFQLGGDLISAFIDDSTAACLSYIDFIVSHASCENVKASDITPPVKSICNANPAAIVDKLVNLGNQFLADVPSNEIALSYIMFFISDILARNNTVSIVESSGSDNFHVHLLMLGMRIIGDTTGAVFPVLERSIQFFIHSSDEFLILRNRKFNIILFRILASLGFPYDSPSAVFTALAERVVSGLRTCVDDYELTKSIIKKATKSMPIVANSDVAKEFLLTHSLPDEFPFMGDHRMKRERDLLYKAAASACKEQLGSLLDTITPRFSRPDAEAVFGLAVDIRGIFSALSDAKSFDTALGWLLGSCGSVFEATIAAAVASPAEGREIYISILKMLCVVIGKANSIASISPFSDHGVRFFQICAASIQAVCSIDLGDDVEDSVCYTHKYRPCHLSYRLLASLLKGRFVCFAAYEIYGNSLFVDTVTAAIQSISNLPENFGNWQKIPEATLTLFYSLVSNQFGVIEGDSDTLNFIVAHCSNLLTDERFDQFSNIAIDTVTKLAACVIQGAVESGDASTLEAVSESLAQSTLSVWGFLFRTKKPVFIIACKMLTTVYQVEAIRESVEAMKNAVIAATPLERQEVCALLWEPFLSGDDNFYSPESKEFKPKLTAVVSFVKDGAINVMLEI